MKLNGDTGGQSGGESPVILSNPWHIPAADTGNRGHRQDHRLDNVCPLVSANLPDCQNRHIQARRTTLVTYPRPIRIWIQMYM